MFNYYILMKYKLHQYTYIQIQVEVTLTVCDFGNLCT